MMDNTFRDRGCGDTVRKGSDEMMPFLGVLGKSSNVKKGDK
jgi:hypothetical protein